MCGSYSFHFVSCRNAQVSKWNLRFIIAQMNEEELIREYEAQGIPLPAPKVFIFYLFR